MFFNTFQAYLSYYFYDTREHAIAAPKTDILFWNINDDHSLGKATNSQGLRMTEGSNSTKVVLFWRSFTVELAEIKHPATI